MTSNLTDRYVAATLRRVPEKQRPEIERELRAAIADDLDARIEQGQSPVDAEYSVLAEMGDPYRLAASYTNHSLTLIGPDFYPAYIRSLKIVGWASLPIVFVVLAIIDFAQGKNVWGSIFGPLGSTITVAVYIAFVVTVMFAIADRAAASHTTTDLSDMAWKPENLAVEVPAPNLTRWGDVISQAVGSLLVVGFLLIDRFAPFVTAGSKGHDVSILDARLWGFWIPLYFVLLALAVALEFVRVSVRRWSPATTLIGNLLGLLGAAAIILTVLTTTVVNPELSNAPVIAQGSWIWWLIAALVALLWVGATINAWRPRTRKTVCA